MRPSACARHSGNNSRPQVDGGDGLEETYVDELTIGTRMQRDAVRQEGRNSLVGYALASSLGARIGGIKVYKRDMTTRTVRSDA